MTEFENEISLLVEEIMGGQRDARRFARLNELLATSAEVRLFYREIIAIHVELKAMDVKVPQLTDNPIRFDFRSAPDTHRKTTIKKGGREEAGE